MSLFKNTILTEKIVESLKSVLPVTFIVLLLLVTIVPVPAAMLVSFLIGAVMLIIGMGLFTLGAETSMTPMGEYVGSEITKSKKLPLIIIVSFIVGVMITISEPDLQVLAEQVSSIENFLLVITVSIGVGIMLVISMLRIIFKIKLKYLLIFFYAIVFGLLFFVPENFIPMSFDSGGVTTGPMTVPFIMALGVGVASIRSDDGAEDDSFGLVALCSIGPILAVMLLGLIFNVDAQVVSDYGMPDADTSRDITMLFVRDIPHYLKEVAIAVFPIVIFFLLFRLLRRGKAGVKKILVGVIYTYVGLVLFLTGVNVGFMPVGNYLGYELAASELSWIIIPLGMVIGYFIVAAEPAVHVLTKQVEAATAGTIPGKALSLSLSLGVAASVGIAMLRVLTGMSILWIIIPGYLIAIVLSFFVPDLFTSVAFDSGGVASGPMTATFLLPFAVGACSAVGGNIVTDAFGVVALVAMTPLIAIQILGLIYKIKLTKAQSNIADTVIDEIDTEQIITPDPSDDDIIEF